MTTSRGLRTQTAAVILYGGITNALGLVTAALVCVATGRHLPVFIAAGVVLALVAGWVAERPVAWLECRLGRAPYCDHCGRPAVGSFYRSLDGPERWHPRCHDAAVKLRRPAGEDL